MFREYSLSRNLKSFNGIFSSIRRTQFYLYFEPAQIKKNKNNKNCACFVLSNMSNYKSTFILIMNQFSFGRKIAFDQRIITWYFTLIIWFLLPLNIRKISHLAVLRKEVFDVIFMTFTTFIFIWNQQWLIILSNYRVTILKKKK